MRKALFAVALLSASLPAPAQIQNIRSFLDRCPQNDPAIAQIRADFVVRRQGVIVDAIPPCSEPVSAMPTSAYTDELIVWQTLRVMYYMDRGMSGHLPWTNLTLYDWVKSRIGGVDVGAGGPFCCQYYGPTLEVPPPPPPGTPPPPPPTPQPFNPRYFFIATPFRDDFTRETDKTWLGISATIALFGHEARHMDDFPHTSCCGLPSGCDQTFDPAKLTPYGIQWWLNKLWFDGTIDVGMSCPPTNINAATTWFVSSLTDYTNRFCDGKPAQVPVPAIVGGVCKYPQRVRTVRHR